MPVLEQDYKTLNYNSFLEKKGSLFGDFDGERNIRRSRIDPETKKQVEEIQKIRGELLSLQTARRGKAEIKQFLGKLDPRLLGGGNLPSNLDFTGELKTRAITIGRKQFTVTPKDDLQHVINRASDAGGGIIHLTSGTYRLSTSIIMPSKIQIIGENTTSTIIDFQDSGAGFTAVGTSIYSTGTITGITSSIFVEGSGTSWVANLTTDHQIFIANRWYKIASITDNTHLVLSEGFAGGGTFPGHTYRAAKIIEDIEFSELTFKDSASTALSLTDIRNLFLEDCIIESNNKGLVVTNGMEAIMDTVLLRTNVSNGAEFNNFSFSDIEGLSSIANGGHGAVLNDVNSVGFGISAWSGNTLNGALIIDAIDCFLQIITSANGLHGTEFVSGNSNLSVSDAVMKANGLDGINLGSSSNEITITSSFIKSNIRHGVNIGSSTCARNIIIGNIIRLNGSSQITDNGTDNEIGHNVTV